MTRVKCAIFCCIWILIGMTMTGCYDLAQREEISLIETETTEECSETTKIVSEKEVVSVHICGAVQNPDVYELPVGARIKDAVSMAGGFQKEADPDRINLARVLVDGEQVVIPLKGSDNSFDKGEAKQEEGKLDLNSATKEQFMELSGIGESKANAIINYRMEQGGFKKIEELKEIPGIKDGVFQKIKDSITVY